MLIPREEPDPMRLATMLARAAGWLWRVKRGAVMAKSNDDPVDAGRHDVGYYYVPAVAAPVAMTESQILALGDELLREMSAAGPAYVGFPELQGLYWYVTPRGARGVCLFEMIPGGGHRLLFHGDARSFTVEHARPGEILHGYRFAACPVPAWLK